MTAPPDTPTSDKASSDKASTDTVPDDGRPPDEAAADAEDGAPPHTRLSLELMSFLEKLEGRDCTIGELVEMIGDRGFGMLLLILALPAALPIPAPGYATPFGIMMVLLGFQLIRGRHSPWLPKFFARRNLSYKVLSFSVRNGHLPLRVVEFLVRPRLQRLSTNRAFLAGVGVTVVLMACFMSLPVPLTNTAPSFVIFVLAAGMLEEDGLLLMGGMLLAPIAASIAGFAVYVAATLGPEAVETTVKPVIKGLLGLG
jgi:hypothetical protein